MDSKLKAISFPVGFKSLAVSFKELFECWFGCMLVAIIAWNINHCHRYIYSMSLTLSRSSQNCVCIYCLLSQCTPLKRPTPTSKCQDHAPWNVSCEIGAELSLVSVRHFALWLKHSLFISKAYAILFLKHPIPSFADSCCCQVHFLLGELSFLPLCHTAQTSLWIGFPLQPLAVSDNATWYCGYRHFLC